MLKSQLQSGLLFPSPFVDIRILNYFPTYNLSVSYAPHETSMLSYKNRNPINTHLTDSVSIGFLSLTLCVNTIFKNSPVSTRTQTLCETDQNTLSQASLGLEDYHLLYRFRKCNASRKLYPASDSSYEWSNICAVMVYLIAELQFVTIIPYAVFLSSNCYLVALFFDNHRLQLRYFVLYLLIHKQIYSCR